MAQLKSARIVAAVPEDLWHEFFSDADIDRLEVLAASISNDASTARPLVRVDDLAEAPNLVETEIVITSWNARPFTETVLDTLPRLRLIAHTGATIRPFVTDAVFDRNILVTQAGQGMARSVAEVSLAFTMALLHRIPQMNEAIRNGPYWYDPDITGVQHELFRSPIAVIGASRTGRAFIDMLRVLDADVLLVDPTISVEEANGIGAELVGLDEALGRARITALHAPTLPQTRHMIGARELALMPDGAGLVNTARSWLVDEIALVNELSTGRICAALDVFDDEPLSPGSLFRHTPGTLLTPHRAAGTIEGRLRQGNIIVNEIEALLNGRRLTHTINPEQLAWMA